MRLMLSLSGPPDPRLRKVAVRHLSRGLQILRGGGDSCRRLIVIVPALDISGVVHCARLPVARRRPLVVVTRDDRVHAERPRS